MTPEQRKGLLALCCLFLGPGFLILGLRSFIQSAPSSRWPHTEGVVIESRVDQRQDAEDLRHYFFLRYRYQVNDTPYENNAVTFTTNTGPARSYPIKGRYRALPGTAVEPSDYPVGARVKVYYDPARPRRAVLIPGVSSAAWFLLLSGAALTAVYLRIALAARKTPPA